MIVHDCEQGSPEWHKLRAGMPTASEFGKLITGGGDASKQLNGYADRLGGELYAGRYLTEFQGNGYTRRGKELEADARYEYEFIHGVEVQEVGFVTDDDMRYGCSPDGLVGNDGAVEIKCLKAENHIDIIRYHKKHGKIPAKYRPQSQGQIMVCFRLWNDQFFYYPNLPPLTVRSYYDFEYWEMMLSQIDKVIKRRDMVVRMLNEY